MHGITKQQGTGILPYKIPHALGPLLPERCKWKLQSLEASLLLTAQGTRYRDLLTNRELDVLQGIADGLTNHEIAQRLTITDETVKSHISSMLRKLTLSHRTQLALFALRNGWVQ